MDHGWDALSGTDAAAAARWLLGCRIGSGGVVVRLTEVEAYGGLGEDPPSHAYRGRTGRNAVMFGPAGFLYVYFTYGMHWCANVVCGPAGTASAVLLRAGEVVEGIDTARSRRSAGRAVPADRDLARGPARLAAALGLDGTATGTPLLDGLGPAHLRPPVSPVDPATVRTGPRVGVSTGAETPWRFWLAGEPTVSPYRRQAPRPEKPRR
jgi:DNA-3-methyladenine glycosylase